MNLKSVFKFYSFNRRTINLMPLYKMKSLLLNICFIVVINQLKYLLRFKLSETYNTNHIKNM